MAQIDDPPAFLAGTETTDEFSNRETRKLLLEAFIACRTTVDDLSGRATALGENLSAPAIAAYLTGKSRISDLKHNVVAAAINARLRELSLPAAAPYRREAARPQAVAHKAGQRRTPRREATHTGSWLQSVISRESQRASHDLADL
jgi:hypothetical protein